MEYDSTVFYGKTVHLSCLQSCRPTGTIWERIQGVFRKVRGLNKRKLKGNSAIADEWAHPFVNSN